MHIFAILEAFAHSIAASMRHPDPIAWAKEVREHFEAHYEQHPELSSPAPDAPVAGQNGGIADTSAQQLPGGVADQDGKPVSEPAPQPAEAAPAAAPTV